MKLAIGTVYEKSQANSICDRKHTMSPGSNKRQTGTVPKTKSAHKNAVPQEVVAPTRRDLQQHINVRGFALSYRSIQHRQFFVVMAQCFQRVKCMYK